MLKWHIIVLEASSSSHVSNETGALKSSEHFINCQSEAASTSTADIINGIYIILFILNVFNYVNDDMHRKHTISPNSTFLSTSEQPLILVNFVEPDVETAFSKTPTIEDNTRDTNINLRPLGNTY